MPDVIMVTKKKNIKDGKPNYKAILKELVENRIISQTKILGDLAWARYYLSSSAVRKAYHKVADRKKQNRIKQLLKKENI